VQRTINDLDPIENSAIPPLAAGPAAGLIANVLVVGLSVVDRMLSQLQVGCWCTVAEYSAANTCAEGQHHVDAAPVFPRTFIA
jgi:hypothetical protein